MTVAILIASLVATILIFLKNLSIFPLDTLATLS